MEYKANEIKAGLMIVSSITILIIFLIAIFGVELGEDTKEYQTYLSYVGGITKGSLVKYGGMNVGHVTEISLPDKDETKIGVRLKVDENTPVRADSKAFVTSIGIMADQHIEISPGSPETQLLPPESTLDSKEVLGFAQMAEPLGELNTQVQELMSRVIDVFSEENRTHFASMIANLDTLVVEGQGHFLKLVTNVEDLTEHLADLSADLNALMDENRGNFDETLTHLQTTTRETSQLISDLRGTLKTFDNMVSANGPGLIEIMENFQFASQNLEEFTRIVKERPWLLVRKAAPPERKIP
ncbi:MCE family protein [candidate division KSB1 bacterium]|nr:MCE family protein [candidate division KSB1 bacterium]NIR70802.1 MCE family protein [candidate division KSB1 bacterium]NIS27815.1 MCE family protein [candidate division KSB1 bacterium]NIT74697.1 MCE family protein [candidate division KSB1 bacterium]NIU28482.1 MCE family protein [candidate division KSB1 bacterium]